MRRNIVLTLMLNAALAGMSRTSTADVFLTGAVAEGTTSVGNYVSFYDWHTTVLPSGAFQLWFIQGSDINGSFINGPGQSQSGIDVHLAVGQNTFTIYGDHNSAFPEIGFYGLNLAFNGVNIPVISVFAPTQTSTSSIPPFSVNPITSQIRWDDSVIASAGTASFRSGDELVTLTNFQYAAINVYNKDRVSAHQVGANGVLDNVGQFTLTVTAVPEPSSFILLCTGAGTGLLALSRRRRRVPQSEVGGQPSNAAACR
jgi:hypothetical protein